jgi:hypothetical protein
VSSAEYCYSSTGAWQAVKGTATEELKLLAGTVNQEVKTRIVTASGNTEKTPEGYRRIRGTHRGRLICLCVNIIHKYKLLTCSR